jgi:LysM repeat protein
LLSLQRFLTLALLAMFTVVVGCGTGTKQSPVASDSLEAGEEVGELSEDYGLEDDEEGSDEEDEFAEEDAEEDEEEAGDLADDEEGDSEFDAVEEKTYADTYTVESGDSLSSIAGKEEIYGDSALWPILQEYNRDTLGNSQAVNVGATLKIPRRLTTEEMDEAREKARQVAATEDDSQPEKVAPEPEEEVADDEPVESEVADAASEEPEVAPEPEEEAPVVKNKPRPVPKPKGKGMMPIFVVIFVVLLLAAIVLLYFMKKDNEDEEA